MKKKSTEEMLAISGGGRAACTQLGLLAGIAIFIPGGAVVAGGILIEAVANGCFEAF